MQFLTSQEGKLRHIMFILVLILSTSFNVLENSNVTL